MKKILALLLAVCLMMTVFTACGDEIDNNPTPSTGTTVGDTSEPTQSDDVVTEPVPDDSQPDNSELLEGMDLSFIEDNGLQFIWDQLSTDVKVNLAGMMNCIKNMEMAYIPKVPISYDERLKFLEFVYFCTMDYTYIGTSFNAPDNDGDGYIDSITIPYNFEVIQYEEDGQKLTDELNAKIDEIVAGMPKDETQWNQIKYLHDSLVLGCEYGEDAKLPFTAYGALVEGRATCQGYADAMHLLLTRAGFETVFAIGHGNSTEVTHKWNYVRLEDGNWYILDPTWADPSGKDDEPYYICYDYFMISDEELMKDHAEKFDNEYYGGDYYYDIPVATSMDLCYHKVMGYFCETYDEAYAAVEKQVRQCAENGTDYIYLRFSNLDVYNDVRQRLLKKDYGGYITEILEKVENETHRGINTGRWAVYDGYKADEGRGPLTMIITLRYVE